MSSDYSDLTADWSDNEPAHTATFEDDDGNEVTADCWCPQGTDH